jgi:putative transposase
MMDKGGENINLKVESLLDKFQITRVIAKFDTEYSNSMIEAFFRSLKNNYLYFQNPSSLKNLKEKIFFYMNEHNCKIPHSAHDGLAPKEVYKNSPTKRIFEKLEKRKNESIELKQSVYYGFAS